MSLAKDGFAANTTDVLDLMEIHNLLGGTRPGRRSAILQVLNKSAIVLITACWEAYIEDVAREAFDAMLNKCVDPQNFPSKVRVLASKILREDPDESKIWELAGQGWRKVLSQHKDKVFKETLERFHWPKAVKVDELFHQLLGVKNLSINWRWKNMTTHSACRKLDRYVDMRGKIAHRVSTGLGVYRSWVVDYLNHVIQLVETTDATVSTHVQSVTGKAPW